MQSDEPVVGERERSGDRQCAIDKRTGHRSSCGEREPQHDHDCRQQGRRQQEPEAGSPERIELAVAEADRNRIPAGEDRHGDERRQRCAFVAGVHG